MSKAFARARRGLLAALVAGALSAVPVSTALACSCMQATIPQSMEFADIAFIGTTRAVEAPPPGEVVNTADPIHYAFAVDSIYKGDVIDAEIVASSAMDGASCGTSFGIDERWLVFANVQDGEIWTGLCSGNVLLGGRGDRDGDRSPSSASRSRSPSRRPRRRTASRSRSR